MQALYSDKSSGLQDPAHRHVGNNLIPSQRLSKNNGVRFHTECIRIARPREQNMAIEHQECNVHIGVDEGIAGFIDSCVGSSLSKVLVPASIIHKCVVHCFDLTQDVFLGWS